MKSPFSIINLLYLAFISLGFSQCSSTKEALKVTEIIEVTETKGPEAYFQYWVAGVRGGGSGTNIYIHKNILDGKFVDSVFFQNRVSKLSKPIAQNEYYTAGFRRTLNQIRTQEFEADGASESVEEKTATDKEFPFDLKLNEAVISYRENDNIKYLKLTHIIEKEMPMYPSAPPNGNR